eukprot:SAG11_NODE_5996_length_1414_cov_1.336882_2_plen_143_part_01
MHCSLRELVDALPYWERLLTYIARVLPVLKDFTVIVSLTFGLLCSTPTVACTLFYFGNKGFDDPNCCDPTGDCPDETISCGWVTKFGVGTADGHPGTEQYVTAFYYAFTILTTVGFGDFSAPTERERIATVLIMLMGAYVFAI